MSADVTVVGCDGAPLPAQAETVLAGARLVVGAQRHLDTAPIPEAATRLRLTSVGDAVRTLAAHDATAGPAVVLASGDPGFFGIVRALRRGGLEPRVVPGRSSVALAFARVGLPWDDAVVVSAHGSTGGRTLRGVHALCRAYPKVAVLTGPGAGPAEIAAGIRGLSRTMVVAAELGLPSEEVVRCTPAAAAGRQWPALAVVLLLRADIDTGTDTGTDAGTDSDAGARRIAGAPGPPPGWALPDSAFRHRASMITKPDVRALVLARLGPAPGLLVWDVGAGSGSVAVECARFGAGVLAVERDPDACADITANARAHGVELEVVAGTAPGALEALPDPDAVFVGGGGLEVLRACLARRPVRLVVTLAAVERAGPAQRLLTEAGYEAEATLLGSARLSALPDSTSRLAPANPVFLIAGVLR